MTQRSVSILDMPVAQVEAIERELGLPVNRWSEAPSLAMLYVAIIAAVEGKPRSEYQALSLRQLSELVSLGGDSDPDPSPPSAL